MKIRVRVYRDWVGDYILEEVNNDGLCPSIARKVLGLKKQVRDSTAGQRFNDKEPSIYGILEIKFTPDKKK